MTSAGEIEVLIITIEDRRETATAEQRAMIDLILVDVRKAGNNVANKDLKTASMIKQLGDTYLEIQAR